MKDIQGSRPNGGRRISKKSPTESNKGGLRQGSSFSKVQGGAKASKKRRWVQPKDKTLVRKKFLRIRDARARSEFSKMQRKTDNVETAKEALTRGPVGSAESNEAFLAKLLDPFAKLKPMEDISASSSSSSATATRRVGKDTGRRGQGNKGNGDCKAQGSPREICETAVETGPLAETKSVSVGSGDREQQTLEQDGMTGLVRPQVAQKDVQHVNRLGSTMHTWNLSSDLEVTDQI
ncbi:hypothetical protein cyc_00631 [Cyclospora cayetanensis]|uniref:Uncharacterized protein n=1 Tax=Cyclospora cayetanensis TaxID=88456 RepID=A0A1D3CTK2_9EIME|nr:hypothetical protein cyc_00631 [Cyclospora cayetanensis]